MKGAPYQTIFSITTKLIDSPRPRIASSYLTINGISTHRGSGLVSPRLGYLAEYVRLGQQRFDGEKFARIGYALLDPVELRLEEDVVVSEDPIVLFIGQDLRKR
ncbi:MAG: hypothetical protein OJF50_004217 [Nitrospira sp.]|jgi:hypothetical protein|nr:hypothetical protein [Nitrospira sp.]